MEELRLGLAESRFADIVWAEAPMRTSTLVERCKEELTWKRTTTYTVLKRLCERGIFEMKDRMVYPLMTREQFYASKSVAFVERNFNSSLPAFLAAFTTQKKLSEGELAQIREWMDSYHKGEADGKGVTSGTRGKKKKGE